MRLFFLILLFPFAVAAQVFDVYSGEHGEFTRLYVSKSLENDYSIHQDGRTVEVSFLKDSEFDISEIWKRISRNRLGRVWQDGRSLFIEMSCDCSLRHINDGNRGVIIDFYGPENITPPAAANRLSAISHLPPFLQKASEASSTRPMLFEVAPMGAIAHIVDRDSSTTRNWAITRNAQFLASNLSKKASRLSVANQALFSGAKEEQCPDAEYIIPSTWGVGTDYLTAKRAAWEKISLGGDPDTSDLHQLVKVEISYGFGLEASALLQASGTSDHSSRVLLALSNLISGSGDFSLMRGWRNCGLDAQLWFSLAANKFGEYSEDEQKYIVASFLSLSTALRSSLLPLWEGAIDENSSATFKIPLNIREYETFSLNLDNKARVNSRSSPEEIISEINDRIFLGNGIPQEYLDLSASLLLNDNTENIARQLAWARFEAAMHMEDFPLAKIIIDNELSEPDLRADAYNSFFRKMPLTASDDFFLTTAFNFEIETLEDDAHALVLSRLKSLGFASQPGKIPDGSSGPIAENLRRSPDMLPSGAEEGTESIARAKAVLLKAESLVESIDILLRNDMGESR